MPSNSNQTVQKGFTLIELMVAITIIAILATLGMIAYGQTQVLARDTKRKQDLDQINKYLQLYYNDNKRYPPNPASCTPNDTTNCFYNSSTGTNWITDLQSYSDHLPQDPTNSGTNPLTADNYVYAYGNVSSDGQHYDLVTRLESAKDGDRCGVMGYKMGTGVRTSTTYWCDGEGTTTFAPSASSVDVLYDASFDR